MLLLILINSLKIIQQSEILSIRICLGKKNQVGNIRRILFDIYINISDMAVKLASFNLVNTYKVLEID